jgi:hypothetical protein
MFIVCFKLIESTPSPVINTFNDVDLLIPNLFFLVFISHFALNESVVFLVKTHMSSLLSVISVFSFGHVDVLIVMINSLFVVFLCSKVFFS